MEGLLVVACEAANLDVVTVLLARGASTDNAVDGKGDAALAIACSKGHVNLVKALLAANADVNRPGNHSLTPLCIACAIHGDAHSEIVLALIAANADVDLADDTGATPLRIACKKGKTHTVYQLIAANANVDKPNNRGETPLVAACRLSKRWAARCARSSERCSLRTPTWSPPMRGSPTGYGRMARMTRGHRSWSSPAGMATHKSWRG